MSAMGSMVGATRVGGVKQKGFLRGFPVAQSVKYPPAGGSDVSLIPGEGNGNPLQY